MSAWPSLPLGELCEINVGRTPSRGRADYWDGDIPWLSIADMRQGRYLATTKEGISRAAAAAAGKIVPSGTVVLSFKLSIGKVGILTTSMFTNEAIAALPVRTPKQLLPSYLYWALRAADLSGGANRAAMGEVLNKASLRNLPIPVPPIRAQRRIAEVLDRADGLGVKRRQTLAVLGELERSAFVAAFGDPSVNPYQFPECELAELVSVGDRINYGVVQPGTHDEAGVPMIRVGDLTVNGVDRSNLKRISPLIESQYSRSRIRGNELLVSCVGSVGSVSMVGPEDVGSNIARAVARVPVDDDDTRQYLMAYLRTKAAQDYFVRELRTVSQPTLNIKQIAATRVLVPPPNLLRKFAIQVGASNRLEVMHRAHLAGLEVLFASLQDKAFRGEL
ncbi:restriction endonuclease subunit S [Micromonospora sp. WMMD1120]|uniref:restriction endonuclease subunit S n=1 Tax=Micromonospora sp. WMMD1120 TaxID=3016106 RepID=UPI0024173B26|nr:restriction endonuclease subunit S [Micromonospora sp. WMMD1120]MDG4806496.1 restriction endonuclease subunit S [Micromonospora sp. WMMD1120]